MTKEAGSVSFYEGLRIIKASWAEVTTETIVNCWRKSGLMATEGLAECNDEPQAEAISSE